MRELIEIRLQNAGQNGTRQGYDEIFAGEGLRPLDSLYHWLIKLLRPQPAKRLLDVACGQSPLSRLATEMGLRAYGVDQSHQALRIVRSAEPLLLSSFGLYLLLTDL